MSATKEHIYRGREGGIHICLISSSVRVTFQFQNPRRTPSVRKVSEVEEEVEKKEEE